MHSSRRFTTIFLFLLLTIWGCGDDSTTPETRVDLTAAQAEDWTLSTLEMVNSMVEEVPDIAAGTMTTLGAGKAAGEPVWDAAQMAWVYDTSMDLDDGQGSTTTISMAYWIQYRNGDGPLPSALGATVVEFRLTESMVMDANDDEGSAHIAFDVSSTLLIGYGEGLYTVDGAGSAAVAATRTMGDHSESMDFSMVWGMDLGQPMAGCPTGTAWIEADAYRMDAVYDGSGNVTWTLIGPGGTASGSDVVACGVTG